MFFLISCFLCKLFSFSLKLKRGAAVEVLIHLYRTGGCIWFLWLVYLLDSAKNSQMTDALMFFQLR